ncbi:hypothetical protein L1049_025345 [Liquidambar formosana]|uniref:EF-hand domain-containing protein n=1 Tax=Liquidambar formosana TaxID=63359 RepID=A0AAP0N3W2_LIQFO
MAKKPRGNDLKPTSLNLLLLLLLLLILCTTVHCRLITTHRSPFDVISDGLHDHLRGPPPFLLRFSESESCKQTYGFMPCTTTVLGNLFLILVYGYLMYLAATYLSGGSERLLEIPGPGIIGGQLLPILRAFPDAMLIFVCGLSGSTETAQEQISVGMGMLAGSTIMLLTIVWGSCVIAGKCDLQDSLATDEQDTKGFSPTGSGISTDIWTSYEAWIMAISIIPFIIVQLPQFLLHSISGTRLAVLTSVVSSLLLLISYIMYQIFQPLIQRRRLAFAKHKHVRSGILKHLQQYGLGRLLKNDGEPNREVIKKLFKSIDTNNDGNIQRGELRALIVGIRFDEIDLDADDAVEKVMKDFDRSNNELIDVEEFVRGISNYLKEAKHSATSRLAGPDIVNILNDHDQQIKRQHYLSGDQSDEVVEGGESPKRIMYKAISMLVLGTIIAAAFADPLVDAVDNFSDATGIPNFFISFTALPLATNSSKAVSVIIFASQKRRRTASLTFSEMYANVTVRNLVSLSVFSALVYVKGLTWDFSAEVLAIIIVCIVMGAFASFRTTFPLWTSLVAFLLYPLSLALIYFLEYVVGWK